MYTFLSIAAAILAITTDIVLKTKLLQQSRYYFFLGVIFMFKLFVNGYLTAHIVNYNARHILGWRLLSIPLEDFIYGFALITFCISIWEWHKEKP